MLGALVLLAACRPAAGWQRTDARVCDPQSPPILCLRADSAALHELHVGERVVLPGECLVGPDEQRGRVAVTVHVSSSEEVSRARVRVRPGARTVVTVAEGERGRLRVVDEQRCDGRVPPGE